MKNIEIHFINNTMTLNKNRKNFKKYQIPIIRKQKVWIIFFSLKFRLQ